MNNHIIAPETAEDAPSEPEIIVAETLTGDVRDGFLTLLKEAGIWSDLKEYQQRSVVAKTTELATGLVRNVVRLVAADARQPIVATVESVTTKKDIKAVLTISKSDPLRHELADSVGKDVVLVVADIRPFQGERAAVEYDPDEPELPMESPGGTDPEE
jgi:hypothetical protein